MIQQLLNAAFIIALFSVIEPYYAEDIDISPYESLDIDNAHESLIALQFPDDPHQGKDKMKMVLDGEFDLVDCRVRPNSFEAEGDGYKNIQCSYCDIGPEHWSKQRASPSTFPSFRDVIGLHETCGDLRYSFDLVELVEAVERWDSERSAGGSCVHQMECGAFIFHQPHSGSTVLSNALAAVDPTARVFAEHPAIESVVHACDKAETVYGQTDCVVEKQIRAARDILRLLTRTCGPEKKAYFKMNDLDTVNMEVLIRAEPTCKWAFLYRHPDVVLQKSVDMKGKTCARNRNNPNTTLKRNVESMGLNMKEMNDEEVCSKNLAVNTEVALDLHSTSNGDSMLIQYEEHIKNEANFKKLITEFFEIDLTIEGRAALIDEERKNYANGRSEEAWNQEQDVVTVTTEVKNANNKFMANVMKRV